MCWITIHSLTMNNEDVWNESELQLAVLQVLLSARRKRPMNGGASGRMLMDCLNWHATNELESAICYLRDKGLIEAGERVCMITAAGVDYLAEHYPPDPPQPEPPGLLLRHRPQVIHPDIRNPRHT
jgi:hypothetical protein